jgi:teichuronic acid biosynthesis glycosyltransferase TuaC
MSTVFSTHNDVSSGRLRVLAVTRIFPNRLEPLACPFQRKQFVALSRHVDLTVMATIPHFPGAGLLGDRYRVGKLSRLPLRDVMDGLPLLHPHALYLPRVGPLLSAINAPLYLTGLLPLVPQLRNQFDVVLGAFLFPDAWAARQIATILNLPYVVKAHGTDVNVTARSASVRPFIRSALRNASATIAVSRPMLDALVALGAPPDRVMHVPNGVDRHLFRPRNRAEARRSLGLPERGKMLLFVGRLEKEKGLEELVAAYRDLITKSSESISLAFLGDGSFRESLAEQVKELKNVHLLGNRPAEDVARYLAAANVLVLPSWAEGTPNVVLEALAAGRPIVATHVGGIPDVVRHDCTGLLVPPRDVPALASALRTALHRSWNEEEIVKTAPPDWDRSGDLLFEVLQRVHSGAQEVARAS